MKKSKPSWTPDRPVSSGATAYHIAVVNTSWHKDNIKELIKIVKNKTQANDVIVDFGAGTGSSAIYLLKKLSIAKLVLVDNSPSWLGHAYQILSSNKKSDFLLLEKFNGKYLTLDKLVGSSSVNHIICANTVHLIPNITETFNGFLKSLKESGSLTFQSGNIKNNKNDGILRIDDTINQVHILGLKLIKTNKKFEKYRKNLDEKIQEQKSQRKLVFPDPRPIEYYLEALKSVGFKKINVTYKPIKVAYDDWKNFLSVKRLQAGILPEIGGKHATPQEEKDRAEIIVLSAEELFKKLKKENPHADSKFFTAEWTYVYAEK